MKEFPYWSPQDQVSLSISLRAQREFLDDLSEVRRGADTQAKQNGSNAASLSLTKSISGSNPVTSTTFSSSGEGPARYTTEIELGLLKALGNAIAIATEAPSENQASPTELTLGSAFGLGQREDFEPLKADEEADASPDKSSLPAQLL